jgi:tetratricopeptide (TPR) repeat protein
MFFTNSRQSKQPLATPFPGQAAVHAVILTVVASLPPAAFAQNSEELRNLVFEPVQIETSELDGELQVRELTSLPASDSPVTTTAYLTANIVEDIEEIALDSNDAIAGYEARIRDLEIEGGAYAEDLIQELLSLGTIYQSLGEHEQALEFLNKALHINRVNLGLFNLDQEHIIEELIESHIALSDLQAADLQQEYLFYLKRKAFGGTSVELLPALTRYAEWNIFAFDSRLVMDPTLAYAAESSMYTENGVSNAIGEENFKTVRLMNAQNIYRTIIQILLNNFGVSDPRLLEIEKRLALTNYFFATNLDLNSNAFSSNNSSLTMASSQGYYDMSRVSSNSMGYRHGKEALERRLEYMLESSGKTPEEIARARIDLGDWLLVFKKRTVALEVYKEAYEELRATGVSQETLDDLFSPVLPVAIPTFIDYRYTRASRDIPEDLALDYQGWFDVRIRINRFGQPSSVDIFGKSLNTTEPIELRLIRHLRSSTSFRPRFKIGELVEEDIVETRYYYSY